MNKTSLGCRQVLLGGYFCKDSRPNVQTGTGGDDPQADFAGETACLSD